LFFVKLSNVLVAVSYERWGKGVIKHHRFIPLNTIYFDSDWCLMTNRDLLVRIKAAAVRVLRWKCVMILYSKRTLIYFYHT
jgi:hypothetical protein